MDLGKNFQQTTDGGYIITGRTESYGAGETDVYLVKTDSMGVEQWSRTFGGGADEYSSGIQQTNDGGYIISGWTASYGPGYTAVYVIKTDSNGIEQWSRAFGGNLEDTGYSIQQTSDGGYIIAGDTWLDGPHGVDGWIIKMDANGDTLWSRIFGSTGWDGANSVQQTTDGGYIVAGYVTPPGAGGTEVFLLKTDSNGNEQWSRTYGNYNGWDSGFSVQQTSDGGYFVTGFTHSDVTDTYDVYLIKTDSNGNTIWTRSYGGSGSEKGCCGIQTSDGGYIVTGNYDNDDDWDLWVIKTDSLGLIQWDQTFGAAPNDEIGSCILQTNDDKYTIVGSTKSFGAGDNDIWLIHLNAETLGMVDDLVVKIIGNDIRLDWSPAQLATGYKIYGGQSPDFNDMTLLTTTTNLYYIHSGVVSTNTKTYYVVTTTDE